MMAVLRRRRCRDIAAGIVNCLPTGLRQRRARIGRRVFVIVVVNVVQRDRTHPRVFRVESVLLMRRCPLEAACVEVVVVRMVRPSKKEFQLFFFREAVGRLGEIGMTNRQGEERRRVRTWVVDSLRVRSGCVHPSVGRISRARVGPFSFGRRSGTANPNAR